MATKAAATPAKSEKKETVQQLKNRLRNEAEREIINRYREEFYEVAEAKFTEHGLEFTRRLTEEEKAQQQIEELLKQHPSLRGRFTLAADGTPRGEEIEGPDYSAVEDEQLDVQPQDQAGAVFSDTAESA